MANQNLNFTITAKDFTQGTFRKLNQSLGLVRKALFNFKVGLTAVAGAAGIGLLVKSSLQSIDTLGKTATKLGVTSQALQKLRYASNLAGVETRTVDMAVQRFTRRLAEAAKGTGEAKGALQELGLDARKLSKMPLEDQMLALSDAFEKVENSGDRVRLSFKLFDSEGVAFLNTLQGGSAALNEMFKEADKLGFVLSSGAVKGVEDTNDSLLKLSMMFKGVRDQIVAGLAPAFRVIVDLIRDKLVKAIEKAGGMKNFAKELALSVIDMAENISKSMQGFVNRIVRGLNFIIDAARSLGRIIDSDTLKSLDRVGTYSFVTAGFFDDLREAVDKTGVSLENTTQKMANMNPQASSLTLKLKEAFGAGKTVAEQFEDSIVKAARSLEDSFAGMVTGTMTAKEAFRNMAQSILGDLARIAAKQAAVSIMGGSGGGNILSSIGSFFGFGGGKAIGGAVRGGQSYMVGERGAEMFVPNQSGTIVPNNKLGGGQVTVNQTINLSTGVSQTVRAEVMNMLPQISEAAKSAVLDARQRGGSFASAFGG